MSKVFVKKGELSLINGGYLTNNEKPVTNYEFVNAQALAHFYVTLAKKVKDKDFVGKPADSFKELFDQTAKEIYNTKIIEVIKPRSANRELTDALAEECLAWNETEIYNEKVKKVNEFITEKFSIINEFETFGLFFEEDIVKLQAIYTIEEIAIALDKIISYL